MNSVGFFVNIPHERTFSAHRRRKSAILCSGPNYRTLNTAGGALASLLVEREGRYVPALDGLRAFAVLAVIAYHMGFKWASGGLMGVTVFFVISGYLINGLLVSERETTGRISLSDFWLRRVRRLFPAILLSVVGTAALCTLFNHALLDKMRPDIVPSLLFFNNWWQIFHDVSYFEAAGSPSPLTHFWSLSIEEQFYVVWPLLLLLMYRVGMKKHNMTRVVFVLAIVSAVAMALLYDPQGDPSRVYYGTDTRAMSLLLGVWLAFVWPCAAFAGETRIKRDKDNVWVWFNLAGVAALAGLVAIVGFTTGFSAFPYLGGIALTSVLSVILIAVLAVPNTWLAQLFSLIPLVWIGKRSYGMYLWHFPLILLTTNANSTSGTPWWVHLVQLALIFVIAELSFRFVEDPIRKGKLGEWWRKRHSRKEGKHHPDAVEKRAAEKIGKHGKNQVEAAAASVLSAATRGKADGSSSTAGKGLSANERAFTSSGSTDSPRAPRTFTVANPSRSVAVTGLCCSVLLVVAGFGVFFVEPSNYADQYAGRASSSETTSESGSSSSGSNASSEPADDATDFGAIFGQKKLNAAGEPIYEPLLIGDSVSLGAVDAFYASFPNGQIDSVVGRNIWESPYPDYLAADQVGDYVVFCLGTNNAVVDWQVEDELLGPVSSDKHVYLMNTRNTLEWCESTNDALAAVAARHDNVKLLDWFSASAGHDEYFAGDGTHLTEEGANAYIGLIREAIQTSLDK